MSAGHVATWDRVKVSNDVSTANEVAVEDWLMASKMWNKVKSGKCY